MSQLWYSIYIALKGLNKLHFKRKSNSFFHNLDFLEKQFAWIENPRRYSAFWFKFKFNYLITFKYVVELWVRLKTILYVILTERNP